MSQALKDYMVTLAMDLDALTRFIDDPEKAVRAAKLGQEDREVLLSGDQARIFGAIGGTRRPEETRQDGDPGETEAAPGSATSPTGAALVYVTPTVVGGVYNSAAVPGGFPAVSDPAAAAWAAYWQALQPAAAGWGYGASSPHPIQSGSVSGSQPVTVAPTVVAVATVIAAQDTAPAPPRTIEEETEDAVGKTAPETNKKSTTPKGATKTAGK